MNDGTAAIAHRRMNAVISRQAHTGHSETIGSNGTLPF